MGSPLDRGEPYSPNDVEGKFSEIRIAPVPNVSEVFFCPSGRTVQRSRPAAGYDLTANVFFLRLAAGQHIGTRSQRT
jgi:hypothetical protein